MLFAMIYECVNMDLFSLVTVAGSGSGNPGGIEAVPPPNDCLPWRRAAAVYSSRVPSLAQVQQHPVADGIHPTN